MCFFFPAFFLCFRHSAFLSFFFCKREGKRGKFFCAFAERGSFCFGFFVFFFLDSLTALARSARSLSKKEKKRNSLEFLAFGYFRFVKMPVAHHRDTLTLGGFLSRWIPTPYARLRSLLLDRVRVVLGGVDEGEGAAAGGEVTRLRSAFPFVFPALRMVHLHLCAPRIPALAPCLMGWPTSTTCCAPRAAAAAAAAEAAEPLLEALQASLAAAALRSKGFAGAASVTNIKCSSGMTKPTRLKTCRESGAVGERERERKRKRREGFFSVF